MPKSIGDAFASNKKYPLALFLKEANFLAMTGLLQGKGDGFAVRYDLSEKGRAELELNRRHGTRERN